MKYNNRNPTIKWKWTTKNVYVDIDTGEIISLKLFLEDYYKIRVKKK